MTRKRYPRFAIRLPLLCVLVLAFVPSASAEWKEKVLYSFQGGATDGALPAGGVVFDTAGNLYGATDQGFGLCPPAQCGSVFQLSPPVKSGDPWTETILHVFTGNSNGDGDSPAGGLVTDNKGNLYGTAAYGGTGDCVLLGTKVGCGVVYKMMPPQIKGGAWTEKVLYSFQGGKDGYLPVGDLTFDKSGNLYGATEYGGGYGSCNSPYYQYCGTIFKLSPPKTKGGKWKETVLYSFKSGTDGANPNGGLVFDAKDAIYGTTYAGGNDTYCKYDTSQGCGTAFELRPPDIKDKAWKEAVLRRFSKDEGNPSAGMIFDGRGYLYGTTLSTVFRLTPLSGDSGSWKHTILFAFCGQNEGCAPAGSLIFDSSGRLYGTTFYGFGDELYGSVFCLKPPGKNEGLWAIDYLYGFVNAPDGLYPAAGLVFNKAGSLYSTTTGGGRGSCSRYCGTVFEVSP
jgi:hypothetical protein